MNFKKILWVKTLEHFKTKLAKFGLFTFSYKFTIVKKVYSSEVYWDYRLRGFNILINYWKVKMAHLFCCGYAKLRVVTSIPKRRWKEKVCVNPISFLRASIPSHFITSQNDVTIYYFIQLLFSIQVVIIINNSTICVPVRKYLIFILCFGHRCLILNKNSSRSRGGVDRWQGCSCSTGGVHRW